MITVILRNELLLVFEPGATNSHLTFERCQNEVQKKTKSGATIAGSKGAHGLRQEESVEVGSKVQGRCTALGCTAENKAQRSKILADDFILLRTPLRGQTACFEF